MGRNILFITTDQQRYDALGCNGGTVARTPVVDALAAAGVRYERAVNQNTVCMPARSTMLTGQYVRTHGVVANGIPLPVDAPSVAAHLAEAAGYRTALLGKAHFEPAFDPQDTFEENARAARGDTGPWRGFERSPRGLPRRRLGRAAAVALRALAGRAPPGAPPQLRRPAPGAARRGHRRPRDQAQPHPPPLVPHRLGGRHHGGVAGGPGRRRRLVLLDELPRPPPPVGPAGIGGRPRRLAGPRPAPGHPGSDEAVRAVLAGKPPHWLGYWEGTFANREGGPAAFVPGRLTHDQIREVNAKIHVMNELIDEACGRVLAAVEARGWLDDTDVIFTTDHGELQGDFGLLYKGPFHTDALMRLPLVWRPAPSAGTAPAVVGDPVGQVDLAPTFCAIAGIVPPDWMQGRPLPVADGEAGRERALCEWDSQFPGYGMHLRSIVRDGWLCTVYEPSTAGQPNGLERTLGPGSPGRAVVGGLRADHDGPRRRRHRHRRAVRPGRGPPPVAQPLGRPRLPGAPRRTRRRPVRQPARRGAPPRRGRPGLSAGPRRRNPWTSCAPPTSASPTCPASRSRPTTPRWPTARAAGCGSTTSTRDRRAAPSCCSCTASRRGRTCTAP